MKEDFNDLKKKFYEIKKRGWIKSDRSDYGGIGITFENLVGIPNNELEIPDFGLIEIKTKTTDCDSYTTLFNRVPTGPHYHEVERLKDLYGYSDSVLKNAKVLNTAIYCNKLTKVESKFYFCLNIDRMNQKIFLNIFNCKKNLIEKEVFWDFDILKEKLYRKLKYLAIIKAKKKLVNGEKFFKYYKMDVYKLKNFDTFIYLIEKGIIRVSLKIGVFRNGNKIGKIHDRGTAFGIKEQNLKYLYSIIDSID